MILGLNDPNRQDRERGAKRDTFEPIAYCQGFEVSPF